MSSGKAARKSAEISGSGEGEGCRDDACSSVLTGVSVDLAIIKLDCVRVILPVPLVLGLPRRFFVGVDDFFIPRLPDDAGRELGTVETAG